MLKAFAVTTLLLAAVTACTPAASTPAANAPSASPLVSPTVVSPAPDGRAAPTSPLGAPGAAWDVNNVVSPVLGNADAKVTIEEYADYQ